ncbi:phosphotransferase family protein [Litorivivens sp.]|uniref:phosphotransferase family protein n=1 Tax=Litorivivens sp. TaxID=2020868 RepID=UPI003564D3A4
MSELKGIELDSVTAWLAANLAGSQAPYNFELIAAGGSNLTYRVTDAKGGIFVLRRPPVKGVVATAHDMSREWRIMDALNRHTDIPVPETLAYCEEASVTGASFYVMEFVDGLILRDQTTTQGLTETQARRATESLVDVQVAFHTLDIDKAGLGELGKRDDYLQRQLKRWHRQAEAVRTRELPLLDQLHAALVEGAPKSERCPGLAHGDYRFDNCVLDKRSGEVIAVLDWELCTLGDPLVDFCWSLQYWAEPGERLTFLQNPPTLNSVFPDRAFVAQLYEHKSGYRLDDLNYYRAFGWWKMACIVEGVYARLKKGAGGGMKTAPVEQVGQMVEAYLEEARRSLGA